MKMPLSFGTTHHRSAALSVLALAMALSMTLPASAQAPNPAGANATKYNIAVVDISYVFKNHRRFKAAMEAMKKEMEKKIERAREDVERLKKQHRQLLQEMRGPVVPKAESIAAPVEAAHETAPAETVAGQASPTAAVDQAPQDPAPETA